MKNVNEGRPLVLIVRDSSVASFLEDRGFYNIDSDIVLKNMKKIIDKLLFPTFVLSFSRLLTFRKIYKKSGLYIDNWFFMYDRALLVGKDHFDNWNKKRWNYLWKLPKIKEIPKDLQDKLLMRNEVKNILIKKGYDKNKLMTHEDYTIVWNTIFDVTKHNVSANNYIEYYCNFGKYYIKNFI